MSIDHYPSSFDFSSKEDDGVLACMVNARGRIAAGHSRSKLISDDGGVCAVGGILAAGGITAEDIYTLPRDPWRSRKSFLAEMIDIIEGQMREDVRIAMKLLDEAAVELVPQSADYMETAWLGPLEWVNQEMIGPRETKAKVLEIYDYAIAKRAAISEPQERELVPA